jgi:hypothetical protein
MGGLVPGTGRWDPEHPDYAQVIVKEDGEEFAAAFSREQLIEETSEHPGWIEIMGVKLDLAVGEDAALAAKWLDSQCSALVRTFLGATGGSGDVSGESTGAAAASAGGGTSRSGCTGSG